MDALLEPFEFAFMQRALAAGLLAVLATSIVGTWVVLRGLSFMGDALAHGVLPGIALAFLWGFDVTLGALVSAIVMVVGVSVVSRRSGLSEDVGIGLLFVGMLALGVIVISRAPTFATDLNSFLFGNVLGVTDGDLVVQAVVAAVVVAASVVLYRAFLVLSFNVDKAAMLGLRPRATNVVLLGLLALAIVSSFRAVGTLLVFGLLVAPPATAALLVRRLPAMMATAVALGAFAVVAGLEISYHMDTAAGATMAGVSVALFFLVLAGRELAARVRRPPLPITP